MIATVIRRVFVSLLFLLFVGGAALLALNPPLVDSLIARIVHFGAPDPSEFSVVHPSPRELKEVVEVKNARIVPQEDTELAFPFDGTLESVVVSEGDIVEEGQVLAVLDTKELRLGEKQAIQRLEGAEASLLKLRKGVRKEDVTVSLEREKLSASTIDSARSVLYDVLLETYTKVDDAFANKLETIIATNPGESTKFIVPLNDA